MGGLIRLQRRLPFSTTIVNWKGYCPLSSTRKDDFEAEPGTVPVTLEPAEDTKDTRELELSTNHADGGKLKLDYLLRREEEQQLMITNIRRDTVRNLATKGLFDRPVLPIPVVVKAFETLYFKPLTINDRCSVHARRSEMRDRLPQDFLRLAGEILQVDQNRRIEASEALSHEFFESVEERVAHDLGFSPPIKHVTTSNMRPSRAFFIPVTGYHWPVVSQELHLGMIKIPCFPAFTTYSCRL